MVRRLVYYALSEGESEPDTEEDTKLCPPTSSPQDEDLSDYQVVDEWDPSMDENPTDIAEQEQESLVPSEDETASEEISSPMVGMARRKTLPFERENVIAPFEEASIAELLFLKEGRPISPLFSSH